MTDWDQIQSDYESGKSADEICKEYNVSRAVFDQASANWRQTAQDDADRSQIDQVKKYIRAEKAFLDSLYDLACSVTEADEAKKLADALAAVRPAVLSNKGDGSSGGISVMIANQFPVPQPDDPNYVPANAVIVGENAQANAIEFDHMVVDVVGTEQDEVLN
jgi:tagatose-1,6-bisphosphate aldolase non-catalytic subunit AgaZ/GatZ